MSFLLSYPLCLILLTLVSFLYTTVYGSFVVQTTQELAIRHRALILKTSHLHFYFHDTLSGQKPSAERIAGPKDSTFITFGNTMMIDDPLTERPEPTSKLIGRAQGLYSEASQHDIALLMVMSFAFLEGKYNGSSITIVGRNPVLNNIREMPVIGGSGLFRFARGYALAHTTWSNPKTGDVVVEYNVYVSHFQEQ